MAGNPASQPGVDVLPPLVDEHRLMVKQLSRVSDEDEFAVRFRVSRSNECSEEVHLQSGVAVQSRNNYPTGMSKTKKCGDCGRKRALSKFPFRNKAKGTYGSRCKECLSAYVAQNRKPTPREKKLEYQRRWWANLSPEKKKKRLKQQAETNRETRRELRRLMFEEYRKRSCVDCGESDPLKLQFDHVRGKKTRSVAAMVSRMVSWARIEEEIKKCEARCASCHQRKTAIELGWYAGLI